MTRNTRIMLSLVALSLGACGGGSGSGSDEPATAYFVSSQIMLTAIQGEPPPSYSAQVMFDGVPADQVFAELSFSGEGVAEMEFIAWNATYATVEIRFTDPADLDPWEHKGLVGIRLCHDAACSRPLYNMPRYLNTSYIVRAAAPPEPNPDPDPTLGVLPVLDRVELGHDVVDAEYSAALEAIVMVSMQPENALHVLYPATGITHSVPLSRTPVALSIAPDGRTAAVGHHGLVSHVELETLGDALPPAPVELALSAQVFDLVLDGRGRAHVIPVELIPVSYPRRIVSIDIATGTEQLGSGSIWAGRARLHPSGDFIYIADHGYPGDLEKWDIRSGVAEFVDDSPYHGDYPICGDVWPSEDGQVLYTPCRVVFRASADPARDMTFAGVFNDSFEGWGRFEALSHSSELGEIMVVDVEARPDCEFSVWAPPCHRRLGIYEDGFLNRIEQYWIPPLSVGGRSYAQEILFVFHSSNGAHRYLLSRLPGVPADPHYLSVLR
jgi:hypothetical protein